MNKIVRNMCIFLCTLCIFFCTSGYIAEDIVVESLHKDIIGKKITEYFLDCIIADYEISDTIVISEKIHNSKHAKNITEKYIDTVVYNITSGDNEKVDIAKDVESIIDEVDLSLQKQEISAHMQRQGEVIKYKLQLAVENIFTAYNAKFLLNIYAVITSKIFKIANIIFTLLVILYVFVMDKKHVVAVICVSLFAVATIYIAEYILIKCSATFLLQRMTGGWVNDINLDMVTTITLVCLLIATGIYILQKRRR